MRLIDQDGVLLIAVTVDELSSALNIRQPIIQWVLAKMAIEPESIDTQFTISPEILKEIRWRAVQAAAEERKAFFAKSSNDKFRAAFLDHCQAVDRAVVEIGVLCQSYPPRSILMDAYKIRIQVAGVVRTLEALKETLR